MLGPLTRGGRASRSSVSSSVSLSLSLRDTCSGSHAGDLCYGETGPMIGRDTSLEAKAYLLELSGPFCNTHASKEARASRCPARDHAAAITPVARPFLDPQPTYRDLLAAEVEPWYPRGWKDVRSDRGGTRAP